MPKGKLPKTQLRALIHLAKHPGADCLSLREASKSRNSPRYIAERLVKKGFATEYNGRHTITEEGLKQLPLSYEMEQWVY